MIHSKLPNNAVSKTFRMKFCCLQISQKANQILDRFLPYEASQILIDFLGDLKTPKFHSEIN